MHGIKNKVQICQKTNLMSECQSTKSLQIDFVDSVLALRNVFLHRVVITVQVFSYAIVDKACSAPDVVLVAVVTSDLVNGVA